MAFPDKFDGYVSTVASQVIKYLHARQNLPLLRSGENCVVPCLSLPAKIHYAHECQVVSALVDSEAAINLIDINLIEELHLSTISCTTPL